MKNYRTKLSQRVRYALVAGMAGAFLIPQVVFAAPTGGTAVFGGATIPTTSSDMNITSSNPNNVITWQDYSIVNGERVQYDGGAKTNNYLNIVTGANTSNINGKIEGGKDVYIVNPNGVIFGKGAEVDVGNLYVSTQDTGTLNQATFIATGASPLSTTDVGLSDVVNMGTLKATNVEVYGKHIRFLNAGDVTATAPVVLHTDMANDGYAHIGYKSSHMPALTDYKINGANAVETDNYYQLVSTTTEFQDINNALTKNYMLENDIDFTVAGNKTAITPIGGNTKNAFTRKFDGNFYKVSNFTVPIVSGRTRYGLFGEINGGRIDNLGVTGAEITLPTNSPQTISVGGIAGYTTGNTILKNVYVTDSKLQGRNSYTGGLVGLTDHTKIEESYSKATTNGGGVIGYAQGYGTVLNDVYSDITLIQNSTGTYMVRNIENTTTGYAGIEINNSYATGELSNSSMTAPPVNNTYIINKSTKKAQLFDSTADAQDMTSVKAYSAWGTSINNTGAPGAKWRIYEGRTTPMLTAFMNGTSTASYNYRYFNADGSYNSDTFNTVKSNNGADVTGLKYNSQYIKIVGSPDTTVGDKTNVIYSDAPDMAKIKDYENGTTKDFDKTNGIRNVGTKAILWTDQDGPNLRGVNVTIDKRKVSLDDSTLNPMRRYNGKKDVTQAFIDALTSGKIKSKGFTTEDQAEHSVQLDFTTGSFKAQMADKNVGTNKTVTFSGTISFSGDDAKNYDFDGTSLSNLHGQATITKAPLYLTIHKTIADAKIYDGTPVVKDDVMKQSVGTPNIELNKTKTAPLTTASDQTIPDGAIMRDENDTVDTVDLKTINDPKYTDASGNEQIHAGAHKLQYTNVGLRTDSGHEDGQNYELYYAPGDAVTDEKVYLDGTINRRQITKDSFKVYDKTTHAEKPAQRVYDGTTEFAPTNVYLSSHAPAVGDTGIVSRDENHITFKLIGDKKGYFIDNSGNRTKNVKEATKLAYQVMGESDAPDTYRLEDYYVLEGTTQKDLNNTFDVTGAGKIIPKALTATVVNNHITKTYDAKQNQTDGNRNDITGDALVTLTGFVGSESRTNKSEAMYATPNVAWNSVTNSPTSQAVTYTAKFDPGTGVEADNYTLDQTAGTTNVLTSQTVAGSYTGTITQRDLKLKFADVEKVYDGTVTNATKTVTGVDDGLSGAVTGADGMTAASLTSAVVSASTSRYGKGSVTAFTEDRHVAPGKLVEYAGLANALGSNHNYKIADKQYGAGTITRRRIDPSSFNVYKTSDNTLATATKVYDGTSNYTPDGSVYLSANAPATGDTGIVSVDQNKVKFELLDPNAANFTKADGTTETSHVSEAAKIAYKVIATTIDSTENPLTNYEFGTTVSKRNLETVNANNPGRVSTTGSITPASLRAATQEISKVYDGLTAHTDGNRTPVTGDTVVSFTGWVVHNGTTEKRTNSSTAEYATEDVAYDGSGNVIKKSVTYTGQLTGQYADDYQIVDAGNHVISTANGSGATKTVTMNAPITVADAGKITPRKLNIKMGDVSKTYDGTSTNTDSSVTEITDAPQTSVIGTILGGDSITTGALRSAWESKRSGGTASSSYGNGTGSAFHADANASNGTPHDVRYTKMDEAFKDAFGTTAAGNYTVDQTVYGKGTINRKAIDPNNFNIVDAHGNASHATKVYDGTSNYTVPSGWNLRPSTGHSTGVVAADADKISFAIDPNRGAHFTKADNTTRTANAYEATRVAYNVKATADSGYEYLLKNYTLNGQNLESGNATATGAGTITRRTINVGLAEASGIDKVYDGNANLVDTANRHHQVFSDDDGRANVGYATGTINANKLVRTKNGYSVDDSAQVTVQGSYADKNVARSGGNVTTKSITYNVKIAGDAGKNYYLTDGSTTVNAENGMNLSATGTITPKDLSGAFKKVTKVYDGTKNVPAAQVGFEIGANGVVAGDVVDLASGHTQEFESENVRGSGTTWTAPDGTRQHNWVNYSNLSLTGADAGNYTLSLGATAQGLGEITPYVLNPTTVTLTTNQASKTYDGTKTVKWTDGSSAPSDQKKYITSATVNINGNHVNVLNDLEVTSAEYDTKNVDSGRSANRVTYNLSYTGQSGNFSLGGASTFAKKYNGVITKKDVTVTVKSPLTKTYDATTGVLGVAKNSANAVVNTANDIIGMTELVSGDGATNESTATYADKHAGTGKAVNYDVKLDTANAGNYNLKYNGNTITAPISTNNNTITKRKVDVTFAPVTKSYDGTPTNTSITPSVSAADASVLSQDNAARVSGTTITGLTGVTSQYGTGTTDATFAANPNAGTNKSVQYAGIGTAMGTVFGANNYDFATNGYGTGTITKANINTSDITFATTGAHKVYDGTRTVKYNGSGASDQVKNYITTATANLGGGHTADLRGDLEIDTAGTKYASSNAGTGIGVTYKFRLNNNNIEISGRNEFEMTDTGRIDRRVLTLDLAQKTGIDKIYDANANLVDTNTRHYDKFIDDDAKGNVTYASGTMNDNKLVRTANGAAVDDGASMTITANYVNAGVADKNAGANKDIAYNVKIGGTQGQNYTLSYNGTTANAETGLDLTGASGTIAKRKITLGFGDVNKMYDTTPNNTTKNITSVTAGNTDGRGAATLAVDRITNASFNMTGVTSLYGAGNTDATFQSNPNVVTDANGNVIPNGKDVQYSNLANTLAAQPYAANYEITNTAYGKGTIRKRTVTANDFTFNINNATKMYDGTKNVVWTEGGRNYTDMGHVKKYFQNSTLDLGGGNTAPINLDDISLNSAQYNSENVASANSVAYDVTINTTNFEFNGTRNRIISHAGDTITKRDLATLLPQHLIKEYDGQTTFDQTNRDYVNAMAKDNLTHIVERDKNKIQLAVTGTYSNKNASAETKAEAEARTPAQAQRTVDYTMTLSGDAATLANYTIGGHPTTNTVTGRAADIYKKTLTVDVARKEKDYDGTAAVNNLTTGDIVFNGLVNGENLSLDAGALNKVQGQYLDSNGNADANVSRDTHRNVLDKAVKYTGFDNALSDLATRNNTAKNYRVADGGKSYTVNDAKGRINPLSINPNHPTDGVTTTFDAAGATKIYDRTRAVKYNGQSTSDALKNYLTSATVRVGTQTVDIKNELAIDPNATLYDNKNAGAGKTVTYAFKYMGNNFSIGDFTRSSTGEIKQKDVKVLPVGTLTKVYDGTSHVHVNGDDSIRTLHSNARVTNGSSVVELENDGIITGDNVQNNSTAVYADKNAGTGKTVVYTPSITGTDAANYRLVDVFGNAIPSGTLTTTDNVIQKRRLNIGFDGLNGVPPVQKAYDTTTKNDKVTARVLNDADGHTRTVLQRDGMGIFGDRLAQLNNGNIQSDYGYGSTDATFRADANADTRKDVQYRGVGNALRNLLGSNAANYDFNDTAYGDGAITRANVTQSDFDLSFDKATKEYDGTKTVVRPEQYLNRAGSTVWLSGVRRSLQNDDVNSVTGEYADKKAAASQPVNYKVKFNTRNFNITDSADNTVAKQGPGEILRRKITVNPVTATKTYDKTSTLMGVAKDDEGRVIDSADRLVKFSHYGDNGDAIIANDVVENRSTGEYADQNVAWEPKANANPNAIWQDRNRVKNKAVNYQFLLGGDDALNYEIVDSNGGVLSSDGLDSSGKGTTGYSPAPLETGRINPYEIHLKADSQTRWINEGLPDSYTGTPQGKGYVTELGETLPGEIRYGSPSARLRWGDYPIEGEYVPETDSETVYQNYLFKSSGTLHIGPYIPDDEYYKALTQMSKMVPDEYAYENASLDRRGHFGRDAEAEVSYEPPSINMVKDGVDISKTGINVTDETVFRLVNEVFG